MKRNKLWLIPCAFFLCCCVLNLIGCLTEGRLDDIVKPALMPLLTVTTFVWLLGHNDKGADNSAAGLLLCAQLFGFAGDTALLGPGFPFFAGGIGLFLVGHIFYITLLGKKSFKGLKAWRWIAGIAAGLAATAALILAIGVNGVMLAPMGIYAFVLSMLIFSALMGVIRFGGLTWWLLLAGACLFAFSDALIAVRSFTGTDFSLYAFVVMLTYLLAQSLLAAGGLRLAVQNP